MSTSIIVRKEIRLKTVHFSVIYRSAKPQDPDLYKVSGPIFRIAARFVRRFALSADTAALRAAIALRHCVQALHAA